MAKPLIVANLTGGRNGFDPPILIPLDQCREAVNVDWWDGGIANKRGGSTALGTTFTSGGPFAGIVGSLIRHVPANSETAAELWGFDSTTVVGRLAGAATWVAPTMTDALSTDATNVTGVSFNGLLVLCYNSTENRLHGWDPFNAKVRRFGLATPAAPTVAAMGAGAVSFTRYYRARWVDINGSDTRRRSEASTSVSITVAAKLGATVTRPALASEEETHWEVEYADASTGPWYRAAQVAAATATYDDTAAAISTTNLSPSAGINTPPPSARFIVTDDNRLLMAGAFESSGGYVTPKDNRVWFTPVVGSTDVGDGERIVFNTAIGNGYIDVEGPITALGGPIQGAIYVFGYRRIWKLVPTGLSGAPYQRFTINTSVGCIHHKSVFVAEDENGAPCLYFLSHRGPYRVGATGLQYLGADVEDTWDTINLEATGIVGHGLYHSDKHQAWWWIATGTANDPNVRLMFDTKLGRTVATDAVRRGWATHTGLGAQARCATLFSRTVGASMSRDLTPTMGQADGNSRIWQGDTSATDDAGTAFQAYVDTREYGTLGMNHAISEGQLIGVVASGVSVSVTVQSDFGLDGTPTASVSLEAAGSETRVQRRLEGLQTAGVGTYSLRIGDAAAIANHWTVDAVVLPVTEQEARG